MQVPAAGKTDVEKEKLELERRKIELEEKKFTYAQVIDEKKLKSDRSAKLWTQFSIFTPLIILIVGFFLNSYAERVRREQTRKEEDTKREQVKKEEMTKERRQFINKQLAEFYYPIQLRLHKDNAIFPVWNKNRYSTNNQKLAKQIEDNVVLPNHEEIMKIIDAHFDLIKNDGEYGEEIYPLMDNIKAYERHVVLYKALKDTGDARKPIQLAEPFPKKFFYYIEKRIVDLENQRDALR